MSVKLSAKCKQIYVTADQPNKAKDDNDEHDPLKYNYSAQHPAYKLLFELGWKKFIFNLQETVNSKKKLRIIQDKDKDYDTPYQLFNYAASFKDWNEYSILCRGMILNPSTRQIIAISFPKFFNFTEYDQYIRKYISDTFNQNNEEQKQQTDESKTSNNNHNIFEKMDGSLGICFYCQYAKKWRVATRGSFISRQSQWASNYISKTKSNLFVRGHTYLFEIIYKSNQIGVDYGNYEGLVLLAAYNNKGFEYKYEYLKSIADKMKFEIAKCYTKDYQNLDEILAAQKEIDCNQEGFVLCLANGFRVKFKGEEYLNMIKGKKHGGSKGFYRDVRKQIIENGVFIKEDILNKYDEEFYDDIGTVFNKIYNDLIKRTQDCIEDLLMTNNLKKQQLFKKNGLNNSPSFVLKARKICDQNLWKSFLVNKSSKKSLGKAVNKITNQVVKQKEWRMFIANQSKMEKKKEVTVIEDNGTEPFWNPQNSRAILKKNNERKNELNGGNDKGQILKKNERKNELNNGNDKVNSQQKLSKSQKRRKRRKKKKLHDNQ